MRQAPDYRVTRLALAPAAATPPILTNDAACQHCVVWLNALAGYFQAQVIQARERAQVGAIKGSIGHVEVFRMDGVGISIIERPRPLHNHDTPNSTQHPYTLKCEEPVYVRKSGPKLQVARPSLGYAASTAPTATRQGLVGLLQRGNALDSPALHEILGRVQCLPNRFSASLTSATLHASLRGYEYAGRDPLSPPAP